MTTIRFNRTPGWGLGLALVLLAGACGTASENGNKSGSIDRLVRRSEGAASAYSGGPPYPGPCVKVGDKGDDDQPEWILRRVYDAEGRVIREVYDHGADGSADAIFHYKYESGQLVERIKDAQADGRADEVQRYQYDEAGRRVEEVFDMRADDSPEKRISYQYDEAGNQTRKSVDYGADGSMDGIWTYTYEKGRPVREEWDQDGDGTIDETVTYEYGEHGLRREALYDGQEEEPAKVVEYDRNERGDVVEQRVYEGGDGKVDRRMRAEYDGAGRRTRLVIDDNADGSPDEITKYKYDKEGNLVREAWDGGANGAVDTSTRFEYDCWR